MSGLKEIYKQHRGAVFGYLYRMTGSAAAAEELTQETFYQAVLSIHRFRGDARVSTWLLKVARHIYLHSLRRRRREQPAGDGTASLVQLPDPGPGPEQALIRADDRAAVHRVLAALPEAYRTALVLREVQELSHREIALILDKTEATVRVLVHRARERFRQVYLREGESE